MGFVSVTKFTLQKLRRELGLIVFGLGLGYVCFGLISVNLVTFISLKIFDIIKDRCMGRKSVQTFARKSVQTLDAWMQ